MPTAITTVSPWLLLAAAVAHVLAVARFTRLVVFDDYPPVVWVRDRYVAATEDGSWLGLVTCPFCFATWPALVSLLWAWLGGLSADSWSGGLWWLTHLWLAGSYLSAMVVVRDQPAILDEPLEPPVS